ncbi:MAG TPA: FlgD immunoglobulin-like domain containing protein [Candidatus Limnocylindrales bacterium]
MRRLALAMLAIAVVGFARPLSVAAAGSSAKVVIVVGPVADHNAHYKADAADIAAEARKYTPNVVKLVTPNATWSAVKAAAQGANVFVYLGHGNGWPSIYPPYQTLTKDGLGLDPSSGADGSRHVYYGEDYIRDNMRFAPNAVVLLYHLCYASGNTEPGLPEGTFADARLRVDNYGAGFIEAGARAVIAEGHPDHPATSEIRALFTTNRTMDQVFRGSPAASGHLQGPMASQRSPGLAFEMDPDTAKPSGFYRSIVGDLGLRARVVTGTPPTPTWVDPADFAVPGAAEVVDPDGIALFKSAARAKDLAATSATVLAAGTRLRLTHAAGTTADGTRIFAAVRLSGSSEGYVRATGLEPRDSTLTVAWSLDHSGPLLSPNADGTGDALVVAARFSEPVSATLKVRNAAGTVVRSQTLSGDLSRFAWNLRDASGKLARDGAYTWSLRARDPWGNAGVAVNGSFKLDGTAPVTKASTTSKAGAGGWRVSPVIVSLGARDGLSGVRGVQYRIGGGATRTYGGPVTLASNGAIGLDYRAIDKAGIREAWRHLAFHIDTVAPSIGLTLAGKAGDAAATWRGPVTVTPAIGDATSGIAAKLVSIDGRAAKALKGPVVVAADGTHTVTVTATDVAGNRAASTKTFRIDTVAPTIKPIVPVDGAQPPTVTPNGDGVTDTLAIPFDVTESATVTAVVKAPDGKPVRTLTLSVSGHGSVTWDGRTAAGKPARDGRYTIALSGRDAAGNVGAVAPVTVDVYAAFANVAETPALFYPQDGDALARTATVTFRLQSRAKVSIQVVDAGGVVVRTAFVDRLTPKGDVAWSWNGRVRGGAYAPPGAYRIVVTATNGTQRVVRSVAVRADAFRLSTSTSAAVRGTPLIITARSAEPLATVPVVVIREPGMPAWTEAMTRSAGSTWTATITPKRAGSAGVLSLTVKARDAGGGRNASVLRLALR